MNFNIDIAIVIGFLIINLAVGLYYGRGIKNIKQYAIGDRNFNTAVLSSTIVATWISGSFFTVSIAQSYKEGLWYIIASVGDALNLLIVGFILAPRFKNFLGSLSVAETMGNYYGKYARIITAICSVATSCGALASQITIFSMIFNYFFNISNTYALVASSVVLITYSSLGGIKAVTFTDVLQIITFGIFIPIFAVFIWQTIGDTELARNALNTPLFDYNQLKLDSPKLLPSFSLFLCFLLPALNPTMFQRILMAKDIKQMKISFFMASIITLLLSVAGSFIAFTVFSYDPNIQEDNLTMYIIDHYSFPVLKIILMLGIIAMTMSTADSWLNAGAVILTHDLLATLGIKLKNELVFSKYCTFFMGLFAVFLAMNANNLLQLILLSYNFYMPVVTIPLILAIFGFRTTAKPFLISVFIAITTVIIWRSFIQPITDIDSMIPGLLANFIAFLSSHYLLKEPGGWIKNSSKQSKDVKKKSIDQVLKYLSDKISKFSLLESCNKSLPNSPNIYIYFFITVFLTLITMISIDRALYQTYLYLISFIQFLVLGIGVLFFCNGLWNKNFKEKYLGIIWYVSVFTSLVVISSFLVLLSNFSHISLIILTIHLTLVPLLLGWRTAIFMIILGLWLSFTMYQLFIGEIISGQIYDFKLKLLYILLLVGGFVATFLKNNQEEFEETKEEATNLSDKVKDLERENICVKNELEIVSHSIKLLDNHFKDKEDLYIKKHAYLYDKIRLLRIETTKAYDMKDEFIRNIPHESNTPLTGIISLSESLYSAYEKLDKTVIKDLLKDIIKSSDRLKSFINNVMDLSKLSSLTYQLNKKELNFGELVKSRTYLYKKIFPDEKQQKFKFEIEDNIRIKVDEYFIIQAIDNLIDNAVKYGKGNEVTINITKNENKILCRIIDQGIGIPEEELYSIFNKFEVSSRTRTQAGGRGIGLTLAQKIIEAHEGKIWVKNNSRDNSIKGVTFYFDIPFEVEDYSIVAKTTLAPIPAG